MIKVKEIKGNGKMKNKKKFIAFYAEDYEFEIFETFQEAKKWLLDYDLNSDGISEKSINGENYIAEITHNSFFRITDIKKNYKNNDEEWPYNDEFDEVGIIEYVPINERKFK